MSIQHHRNSVSFLIYNSFFFPLEKLTPIIYDIEVVNLYPCANKPTFYLGSLALDYLANMLHSKVTSVTPFTVIMLFIHNKVNCICCV